MTYSAPLKVTMRLTIYDKDPETGNRSIRDMKEQEVFFGDIPLMTANGTSSSTARARDRQPVTPFAGVFFETANNRTYFLARSFLPRLLGRVRIRPEERALRAHRPQAQVPGKHLPARAGFALG